MLLKYHIKPKHANFFLALISTLAYSGIMHHVKEKRKERSNRTKKEKEKKKERRKKERKKRKKERKKTERKKGCIT